MQNLQNTQYNLNLNAKPSEENNNVDIEKALQTVFEALCEKGYNPVSQMAGYIMSEDPTYITSHNGARRIMSRLDRYDVLEVLLKKYFKNN